MWRAIVFVGGELNLRGKIMHKGVGFVVGNGKDVRFWLDE